MGCVDARYRPLRDRPLRAASSRAAGDASATTRTRCCSRPTSRNPDRDEAQFADLGRLFTVLDRLTARAAHPRCAAGASACT